MTKKLMLVDGNSILNRAFYGIKNQQMLQTSDGIFTNAVYGFVNITKMYMDEVKPDYICVAFDMAAKTFRHKEFDGYKAKRKGMPEDLAMQMPIIKEVLDAMDIARLECEGYEADDIIGTVSSKAVNDGFEVFIITGDRDSLQLIDKGVVVKIPSTSKGLTSTTDYNIEKIRKDYGIEPKQFIEVKALMGDASDNIPGVKGIGEKTALKLITEYKSIDNLYDNIDTILPEKVREKLINDKDDCLMSRSLAKIDTAVPCIEALDILKYDGYDKKKLYDIFKKLEFKSLIEKYKLASEKKTLVLADVEAVDNISQLDEAMNNISNADNAAVSYAIGDDGEISCIAFAWSGDGYIYVDMSKFMHQKKVYDKISNLLSCRKQGLIGFDVKNLILYMKRYSYSAPQFTFDIKLAAFLINSLKSNIDINETVSIYLGEEIPQINEQNCASILVLQAEKMIELKRVLHENLEKNEQTYLFYDVEMPLIEVLAEIEIRGFKIDEAALKKYHETLQLKVDEITMNIYEMTECTFNINSPKQLGEVLFDKLSLPVIKKTKTGYSTNIDVLEKLKGKHPVIESILEYRQLMKIKSTYVDGLLRAVNPDSGKVHTSFNQAAVVTGRLSSTEPNLQNIPIKTPVGREIRKSFIPSSENYCLVDADYSQIELRVLAHIADDTEMKKAFENNEDIHTTTAAKIFGINNSEVTSEMRAGAKAVNFGIVYGIGEFSLSEDLGISRKEAKKYIDDYLKKYPGVHQYMKDIVEKGIRDGYVTTLFKRRRYIPELMAKNKIVKSFGERMALNTPIQGTAADIIKIAMVKVYNELKKRNLRSFLVLQVHDELLIEAHETERDEVEKLLIECMEKAVKLNIPLKVDLKSGYNWFDTK